MIRLRPYKESDAHTYHILGEEWNCLELETVF